MPAIDAGGWVRRRAQGNPRAATRLRPSRSVGTDSTADSLRGWACRSGALPAPHEATSAMCREQPTTDTSCPRCITLSANMLANTQTLTGNPRLRRSVDVWLDVTRADSVPNAVQRPNLSGD